jgi:mono/diheme cytochrome c family protein
MKILFLSLLIVFLSTTLKAEEPLNLKILDSNGKQLSLSPTELLSSLDCEDIVIPKGADPAYPDREMHYRAIKISRLFAGLEVDKDDLLAFEATDGFSALLLNNSSDLALDRKKSKDLKAYLAIEDAKLPWPDLGIRHKGTAGPFYVVWTNADRNQIGNEEWVYKLAQLKLIPSIEKQFPKLIPKNTKTNAIEMEGLYHFIKTCFACHSLNLEGGDKKGPDLNIPENPVEYFGEKRLLKFVRNPQAVRHWKNSQMAGFSEETLSDSDFKKIVVYLKHMAKNRF